MTHIDFHNLPADIILRKSRENPESDDDIFKRHRPRLVALAKEHGLHYSIAEDVVSGAESVKANAIFGQVIQNAAEGGYQR